VVPEVGPERRPAVVGGGPRWPGSGPSAFVNGLNDVDRYQRWSASTGGWA
jgi:hypothetical protein